MLDGRHFTILCDNQAVVQSLAEKNSENFSARTRILRQLQYISQFSTDCRFIESDKNLVADALTLANVALISDLPNAINQWFPTFFSHAPHSKNYQAYGPLNF